MENKICQNCKQNFVIEADDFDFYKKIDVLAPTWCPECRMQRRMVFMNDRTLYTRDCDLCKKKIISVYPADSPNKIYCNSCWWSDKWQPESFGREYDFSKPFFSQFKELMDAVPWPALDTIEPTMVNSQYCSMCSYLKNCYLLFNSDYSEDCAYSTYLERSKRSFDMCMADLCELCYEGTNMFKCFKTFFSANCQDCVEVAFSKNLKGCSNCFGCVNLRNKQYHIFNIPVSKEDYAETLKNFRIGSYRAVADIQKKLNELEMRQPKKYMEGTNNSNVSGHYVFNSKNTFKAYEVGGCENCKYCHYLFLASTKDSWDFTMWGGGASWMYECMGCGGGQQDIKFSYGCWSNSTDLEYCMMTKVSCSHLFGCIGLRNKKYCILNKQYTKEEYEALVPKIRKHMSDMPYKDALNRTYGYGEFFPPELSHFAYNESVAQQFLPLDEEKTKSIGLRWKNPPEKDYGITMLSQDLPDDIADVRDDILQFTIGCEHKGACNHQCSTAFRLTPSELEFYRSMNLPLPRICPNCRHYARLNKKNPIRLYPGRCACAGEKSGDGAYANAAKHFHGAAPCPNKFETSYAPEREEIIYCDQCYNSEVV